MIVIIDERQPVVDAYVALLHREGVAACGLCASEFKGWITAVPDSDVKAIEAFLVGDCEGRPRLCSMIAGRCSAVVIALSEARSLDETLELFAAGVDDVIRKPVHIKEILARVNAAARRTKSKSDSIAIGDVRIFLDGRDPEIGGEPLLLPRRELRILTYLAGSVGCRVSKSQIFNAVYGLFNDEVDESVIESHISKLRKRLRQRLGYDPIDSKRYLGYRLISIAVVEAPDLAPPVCVRSAQDSSRFMGEELQLHQD